MSRRYRDFPLAPVPKMHSFPIKITVTDGKETLRDVRQLDKQQTGSSLKGGK